MDEPRNYKAAISTTSGTHQRTIETACSSGWISQMSCSASTQTYETVGDMERQLNLLIKDCNSLKENELVSKLVSSEFSQFLRTLKVGPEELVVNTLSYLDSNTQLFSLKFSSILQSIITSISMRKEMVCINEAFFSYSINN